MLRHVLLGAGRRAAVAAPSRAASTVLEHRVKESAHHAGSYKMWQKVSLGAVVVVAAVGYRTATLPHPHLPEHVDYPHLHKRVKPFPWGDGQTTLFHTEGFNWHPDPEGLKARQEAGELGFLGKIWKARMDNEEARLAKRNSYIERAYADAVGDRQMKQEPHFLPPRFKAYDKPSRTAGLDFSGK